MKKINFLTLVLLALIHSDLTFGQNIVINEILASNSSSITDEDNSYQDWIELYNGGSTAVNLQGYGLSDDPLQPFKWTFPNIALNPNSYLIIWASDKNRSVAGYQLHTNFKISADGENIILTKASGTILDTFPPVLLQPNISYGRYPNGSNTFAYFKSPTPKASNSTTGYPGALKPPIFTADGGFTGDSGFFLTSFNLTLSSSEPGTTILYTTDGSEPDENNLSGTTYSYKNQYINLPGEKDGSLLTNSYRTLTYNLPITISDRSNQPNKVSMISSTFDNDPSYYFPDNPIFKGTIIRAKVIKPGYISSQTITKNYFITPQGVNKFTLPIVSLSLNEDRFFEYYNGIYVAGKDFDDWRKLNPNGTGSNSKKGNYYRETDDERVGHMNYFVNGIEKINQDIGLKIRGGSTRRYEKKSLTVYARSDYGDGTLDYNFFSDLPYDSYDLPYNSYERLTLSNSGWDFRLTKYRDALIHQLCKGLNVEIEAWQPAITFINGEYWGLTNIRERYDDNYFDRVYKTKNVDLLENSADVKEGDPIHYNAMIDYIETHSMADQSYYDYIKTQLDPESFTDFQIIYIFFQNSDWPDNNTLYWRNKISSYNPSAPYGLDGRWRWMLHDLDATFSFGTNDFNGNTLQIATSINTTDNNPDWSTLLLRKLLENDSFKINFINRFADLLNTSFLPTRVISKMDEMKNIIEPEMPQELIRWNIPSDLNQWNSYLTKQKDFANARPEFQRNHIRQKFGINKNVNVKLDVSNSSHGYIKINSIEIIDGTPGIIGNPNSWTGIYFHNIPIKLKAIAKPGYEFDHWSGASNSNQNEITITPTDNISLTAVFVKSNQETLEPIYFWMMDTSIVNEAQLTSLNSTFHPYSNGMIKYQSCMSGYPLPSTDDNYGKASMERRSKATDINYRPEANNNVPYASSNMKGLQIKEPLQKDGQENIMMLEIPTSGFKNIKLTFAAINEDTFATGISVDYSINNGNPNWITDGLPTNLLHLTNEYQLFEINFSNVQNVENNPYFKVRLRFTGNNMTIDKGNRITFNNIAVDGVKIPLFYPSPNVFTVGTTISNLTPTVTQSVSEYSINPNLPSGLSLNSTTGIISGKPTAVSSSKAYTVTAKSTDGNLSCVLFITVNDVPPSNLNYTTPNIFTKGTTINNLIPMVSGGNVVSFSISPNLPNGLNFNSQTGIISGTPTEIAVPKNYTVTAQNSGGSTSFSINITVNDAAPKNLTYVTPNVFTKGITINDLTPSVSGGKVVNFSITPNLPNGLNFNIQTGIVSGTPTEISNSKNYTVTAQNSGGSTSFSINISIIDIPSSVLSYTTPNAFTKGIAISNLIPTYAGNDVINYSINPNLPDGLSFNTQTGIISGTPTQITVAKNYTVTAVNISGNSTFTLSIVINDTPPTNLSYATPNVFTKETNINSLSPTVSGGKVINYSVSPNLPNGLNLDIQTGIISGTPTEISASQNYEVRAENSGGSTSFIINISIIDLAPQNLTYSSPNGFTKGISINNLAPTVSGGKVIDYSISPDLPNGLNFDAKTGIISGIPTEITSSNDYTVIAQNSGGSSSFTINITVNDISPTNLTYNTPNIFTKGMNIANLTPIISGGNVINYIISPNLPKGLIFDYQTGIISGIPTEISVAQNYVVKAQNSGGSISFTINIVVNDSPPNDLTYMSPNIFTKGIAITNLIPSVLGGTVTNYNVTPNLPSGLNINNLSGVISGTPNEVSEIKTYLVTAQNSGGNASFNLIITVQSSLSVAEDKMKSLKIYPNPFSNKIKIFGFDQPFFYRLFTIEGKLIKSELNSDDELDLGELTEGVYLLELSTSEFSMVKKIIKSR